MFYSVSFTEAQYNQLQTHLFPKDGKEAAAIAFCYPCQTKNIFKFIINEIVLIPYKESKKRSFIYIDWNFSKHFPPEKIEELDKKKLSILTIHSHPNGLKAFSELDDDNDKKLFSSVNAWFDDNRPNGALIFLPRGEIIGRVVSYEGEFTPIEKFSIAGNSIQVLSSKKTKNKDYSIRIEQTFGKGTLNILRNLKVGVIGCSGTGSIVIELLVRNCVGELLLVDKDVIEEKNLNRIINSNMQHAKNKQSKVSVLKEAIEKMGLGTKISILEKATYEKGVLHQIKECDVVFGCVDSTEGRLHLDTLSCSYLIPYFEVGVKLEVAGNGEIMQAIAKVRYINPEGPYLLDMQGYTVKQVEAESYKRNNASHYNKNKIAGYLEMVQEDQPAVISLNMQAACLSVNDFLARLHNYRIDDNVEFTEQSISLTNGSYIHNNKKDIGKSQLERYFAKGDKSNLMLNK